MKTVKPDLLTSAVNEPKEKLIQKSFFPVRISEEAFKDPKMRAIFFSPDRKELSYTLEDAKKGVCHGIMIWFLNLLFESLHNSENPNIEQHILAVAKQFTEGAGKAPVLLQMMGRGEAQLFRMGASHQASIRNFPQNSEQFCKKFNRLKPGIYAYALGFSSTSGESGGHGCPLIKISDRLAYIFDPNLGLIRREGDNLGELIYNHAQLVAQIEKGFLFDIAEADATFFSMAKEGVSLENVFASANGQTGFFAGFLAFFSTFLMFFSVFFGLE